MCGATSFIPLTGIVAMILLTMKMGPADAAIGYDCETRLPNKTIALIDIDYCDLDIFVKTSTEDIALLQLNEFGNATVIQCKIEIRRAIYNCGWQSNNLLVTNSTREYIYPISRKACQIAHDHGTVKMRDMIIDGLRVDMITTRNVTLAGSVDSTGACIGAKYSDPYGTWNNVVVTGTVKITLQTQLAEVKLDNDTINLPSGHQCKLSKEQCIDFDGGFTFRDTLPRRFCNPNTYSILYKGNATKLTTTTRENSVYSVIVDDTRFSFIAVGNEISCGVTLLKTESPKLFIIKSNDLKLLQEFNIVDNRTNNFDMAQYKNAQFILVENTRYIRYPAVYWHRNVIEHKCKRESKILKNMLPIASTHPDEFAVQYMGGPGYTAVVEEDRFHIVPCVPVEVKLEQMDKCYNRLPILRGNRTLFLTPKTHIITNNAIELACDSLLPVQTSPDTNGNITGVIYLDRDDSNSRWYKTWNTYSVIALVSVSVFSILVTIFIIKMISNRQRRRRIESDHHDVTMKFNNHHQGS